MPELIGNIPFIGTVGRVCFYRVGKQIFIRTKSSLTGKRVKKDPAFHRTMENARLLGRAAKIASVVYKGLAKDFRQFWMYRAFTGEAIGLLRQGMPDENIKDLLWKTYVKASPRPKASSPQPVSQINIQGVFLKDTSKKQAGPGSVRKPKPKYAGFYSSGLLIYCSGSPPLPAWPHKRTAMPERIPPGVYRSPALKRLKAARSLVLTESH